MNDFPPAVVSITVQSTRSFLFGSVGSYIYSWFHQPSVPLERNETEVKQRGGKV